MFGVHEKLYLQKKDARYVRNNLIDAAHKKIALSLPVGEDDLVRSKVTKIVDKFIDDGFELSKYSMVIDDKELGAKESMKKILGRVQPTADEQEEEEIEPFDFELNEKLRDIYYEVENLTTKVTQKRAGVPMSFSSSIKQVSEANLKKIDGMIEASKAKDIEGSHANNDNKTELDGDALEQFGESLVELNKLKSEMADRKDQLVKLGDLVGYLERRSESY